MDVVCIGNLSVDYIFLLDRFPDRHEKMVAKEFHRFLGGAAGNVATMLAFLGFKVGFIGAVGNDSDGREHLEFFKKIGVDISHIKIVKERTGIAVIFSAGEDKRMIKYPGANSYREIDYEYLRKAKHVHISAEHPEVVEFCRSEGISVSVDGRKYDADIVFMNEDEWIRNGKPKNAVVMLNRGGGMYGDVVLRYGEKDVVDTTGAGDSFISGFLYGYLKGEDIEKCLKYGIAMASYNVKRIGARHPLSAKELEKLVKEINPQISPSSIS